MSAVRHLLLFVLAAAFMSLDAARGQDLPTSTRGGSAELAAGPVVEVTLTRTFNQLTSCETRNRTGSLNPYLNVVRENADQSITDVAHNDDGAGNLNARISFRALAVGRYTILMRPARGTGAGTADLYCDGRPVVLRVALGGAFRQFESLRQGETLRTVVMPGGPRSHTLFLFDNDGAMVGRYRSGSPESAFAQNLQGTRSALVASRWPDTAGTIRLVRNDAALSGHDADHDGLGVELESQFGTCAAVSDVVAGWPCSRAADLRDTDGDGLRDDEEMLGRLSAAPYQWLPRWGADPRHKDIFIEIDFGQERRNEVPVVSCTADDGSRTETAYFCAASARRMAAIYADAGDLYPGDTAASALVRLSHARTMNSPDQRPGISLHFDTGVDPPAGAPVSELTLYGDWGGHSIVVPVQGMDGLVRASAGDVVDANMAETRKGLFHYALGDAGGAGAANGPLPYLNFPMADEFGAAHEFGHTLGLEHFGPQGAGTAIEQDDGSGRDLNCKPNYPSIMNYAYYRLQRSVFAPTFSDGAGRPAINNLSAPEQHAVPRPQDPASARYLHLLRDAFAYRVDLDTGAVDWNRDGAFSATPVRARVNYRPGIDCEGTRQTRLRAPGESTRTPAITALGARTIILLSDTQDRLQLDWADGLNACPNFGDHCAPMHASAIEGAWNHDILAVDAHPITENGQRVLLVIYRTPSGLFETTMSDQFNWSPPRAISVSHTPVSEVSLAASGQTAWLIFRDGDDNAVFKRRDAGGVWANDDVVQPDGRAFHLEQGTDPSILFVHMRDGHNVIWTVMNENGPGGSLRLFAYTPAQNLWHETNYTIDGFSRGRPGLAFVPTSPASTLPGRFYVLYMRPNFNDLDNVDQYIAAQSVLEVDADGTKMRLSPHDNGWLAALGGDLWFDAASDLNVRAALTVNYKDAPPHSVWLRPKADGIVGRTQRDFNDWQALALGTCRSLLRPDAEVHCAPWPFHALADDPVTAAPLDGAFANVVANPAPPSSSGATSPSAMCTTRCTDLFDACIANANTSTQRLCRRSRAQCVARC